MSFQTISLLFNNEPVQPSITGNLNTDTLLYHFPHGYSYIPRTWFTWYNSSPSSPADPDIGGTATTFAEFGDETANGDIPGIGLASQQSLLGIIAYNDPIDGLGEYTTAFIYTEIDTKNFSIYVRKQALQTTSDNTTIPIYLAGITLNMRCYVFTEPADTSTY